MEFAWLSFNVDLKRETTMKTIVRRMLISGFALLFVVPAAIIFGLGLASIYYMRRRGAA